MRLGTNMVEYIPVGEALQLVSPFKGEKEVLAFMSNVDTAFEVIKPEHSDILYKFVLTRISGEPRVAIAHRTLENMNFLVRSRYYMSPITFVSTLTDTFIAAIHKRRVCCLL